MWNINQFVEILNKKIPLVNINKSDKRKSEIWTVRMVREYCSKHDIRGVKSGKFLYYTEENLKQLQEIMAIKSIADVTSKSLSYSSIAGSDVFLNSDLLSSIPVSNKNNVLNFSGNSSSSNDRISAIFNEGVNNKNKEDTISRLITTSNKTNIIRTQKVIINIEKNIEIVAPGDMSNREIIKNIKQWLGKIGE